MIEASEESDGDHYIEKLRRQRRENKRQQSNRGVSLDVSARSVTPITDNNDRDHVPNNASGANDLNAIIDQFEQELKQYERKSFKSNRNGGRRAGN